MNKTWEQLQFCPWPLGAADLRCFVQTSLPRVPGDWGGEGLLPAHTCRELRLKTGGRKAENRRREKCCWDRHSRSEPNRTEPDRSDLIWFGFWRSRPDPPGPTWDFLHVSQLFSEAGSEGAADMVSSLTGTGPGPGPGLGSGSGPGPGPGDAPFWSRSGFWDRPWSEPEPETVLRP